MSTLLYVVAFAVGSGIGGVVGWILRGDMDDEVRQREYAYHMRSMGVEGSPQENTTLGEE